jgi:peptide/histidine transporter 3/4
LLLVGCCKYHWFSTNTGRHNPYKTVCKVLSFARKHNYPLRRSAFTFCDKYIPSRLDFAKERFGGPFPTEKVENVKTFLRILTILLAIGPVFMLEVPASYFVFPIFSLHTIHYHKIRNYHFCASNHTMILSWETFTGNGTVMAIFSNVIWFPMYLWIAFSCFHNRMPRIFTRIGFGVVVCLLGVTSMLIIDVAGHALNTNGATNQTQCMFSNE